MVDALQPLYCVDQNDKICNLSLMPKPKRKRGPRRATVRLATELLPKHEAFAQAVADGCSATEAYRRCIAGPDCKTASCMSEGSQLLQLPEVAERVKMLRTNMRRVLEEKLGVKQETIARYLMEVLETPVGDVEEGHRLAQEQGKFGMKMFSKAEAAKILNQMAGWNAPEKVQAVVTSSESVALALEKHFARAKKVENGD